MLGLGRALGETMAVTFIIGNTYQLDSASLYMPGNSITSALANEFAEAESGLHVAALMELGLILFVLFSVLLVPVRYRAEGSIYEHLKGSASASWFMRLISIKVSYDGEAQMDFRILWFHPGRGKDGEAENALEQERGGAGGNRRK